MASLARRSPSAGTTTCCRPSAASTAPVASTTCSASPPTAAPPPTGSTEQPWFDGNLGVNGASYMGFTAYSLASTRAAEPQGDVRVGVRLRPPLRVAVGRVVALESSCSAGTWAQWRLAQSGAGARWRRSHAEARRPAPLRFRGRVRAPPDGRRREAHDRRGHPAGHAAARALRARRPFWDPLVFTDLLDGFDVPTCLVDNWYDYQLPADDRRLPDPRRCGRRRTGWSCVARRARR